MISPRISGWQHGGQVEAASLSRLNELEDMREKLEARKMKMVNLSMHYAIAAENNKGQEEELNVQVTSLLVAGTSLSLSRKQLQVIAVSQEFVFDGQWAHFIFFGI